MTFNNNNPFLDLSKFKLLNLISSKSKIKIISLMFILEMKTLIFKNSQK